MQNRTTPRKAARRGSVAVEMAMIAPVLLIILLGTVETCRMCDVTNRLATAAREGARLAAMDRSDIVAEGQTTNEKILSDIQGFLAASGLPVDQTSVVIAERDDPDTEFDMDDPANELRLFQIRVTLPYSAMNPLAPSLANDYTLVGRVVFRNAQSSMVQ